ncbi:MAG TPA: MATE family efflux transporter, partial [Candidatus Gracilibacteria bacterium]
MGSGDLRRVREVFKKASLMGFFSATILGLLLMVGGRAIIRVFTEDPVVMQYSIWYLFIVAGTYGCLAVGMIVANVFQSMGSSWPGFWLFFVKFFVISIPLSYLVTHVYHFPIWSVWGVIAASNFLMAAFGYLWLEKRLGKV